MRHDLLEALQASSSTSRDSAPASTPDVKGGQPANTGGGSSVGSALRAGSIRSALEIVPARLAQILILALLASASLPEYISPNRAFRPDF